MANPSPSNYIRVHVLVTGRVQGVGYRAATGDRATLLKLNGWVCNLPDGRVEAVFEGPQPQIEEMLRWCQQGPPLAIVQHLQVTEELPEGLRGFQITHP